MLWHLHGGGQQLQTLVPTSSFFCPFAHAATAKVPQFIATSTWGKQPRHRAYTRRCKKGRPPPRLRDGGSELRRLEKHRLDRFVLGEKKKKKKRKCS